MSKKFRKLRILWCGEASFLNTGYSVFMLKKLLTRLYKTGKYKIAEMACYADVTTIAANIRHSRGGYILQCQ